MIRQPWPWYVAGPLIGLTVPALLLLGNKSFGISSSMRHVCAACVPAGIPFFQYNWKKEAWNLFFVGGVLAGGFIAAQWVANPMPPVIHMQLAQDLSNAGIDTPQGLLPPEIFSWSALLSPRGFFMMVIGGFLVGYGTRYAGGCTSGHAIMGLSTLQWPSLVATIAFMAGGIFMTHLLLPYILHW